MPWMCLHFKSSPSKSKQNKKQKEKKKNNSLDFFVKDTLCTVEQQDW